ncbi:phosphoenolpyruvate synthase [Sulfuriflexus mobilis]|uniref:phosphoenolpyruvate synthase n=1 Tax=Sulfuriflexus mobilis TaxID=1811807 RepID=UPI000F845BAC|nr:phosphoenolpyruvate synthase [Sulfuriflexus mobilis]
MQYVRTFNTLGIHDIELVGGKNASLGEMISELAALGLRVPDGFATTAEAYWYFLDHNQLRQPITNALAELDVRNVTALAKTGKQIRDWILGAELPADLASEMRQAYADLAGVYGASPDVAMRSSATAEDLPGASFAGQQNTYLNIVGEQTVLKTCLQVFASLFNDRAIAYRVDKGFEHMKVALSIGVQKMVRADLGASGVMFTLDTESGFRDVVLINAAYGLGENVVQGTVNPDEYHVFKPNLDNVHRPILKRDLGDKALRMVYDKSGTRNEAVPEAEQNRFVLSDDEILSLARQAVIIEQHYSNKASEARPMDIEWARDGKDGLLYILQARPETIHAISEPGHYEQFVLDERAEILCTGKSVGRRIASGKVRVIQNASEMRSLQQGEILVTDITDPDWEPIMKIASAIVTNRGGRTCHAAIIARELGIPAVVGCGNATTTLYSGQAVTVACSEGDEGFIFASKLAWHTTTIEPFTGERPRTKLMLNVGDPQQAYSLSQLPSDGVGLARLEFIINHYIGVHPRALLEMDMLDAGVRRDVEQRCRAFASPREFYIQRLAEGIGSIAAAFSPRPVIVRLSDFKSNEYAALVGGQYFEPLEENPMLGFRGASRYPSQDFTECFRMECEALVYVRQTMGLDNVAVMIPFVRTIDEAREVLTIMEEFGLKRGDQGLRVYLMCELPANALLADEFLELFDGFSIGSNDLTQLTLGVDRDSSLVKDFDERNPAVLKLMEMAITACKRADKYIGICGQAPSDYPEITHWLVGKGISSISFNPDSLAPMFDIVRDAERQDD